MLAKAKRLRSEFVVGVEGRGAGAIGRDGEPEARHRAGRGGGPAADHPQRGEDAAVPDRRRHAGVGGRPAQVPLPGPATAGPARQPGAAAQGDHRRAALLRPARLHRGGDADSHQVHARGRARLPGAEPRAPRGVLRPAAVAAALQADPDGGRPRPLRADLQVLPRRGPARRPPARVHADRRGDVVRAARDDLRPHRAADARRVRRHRPHHRDAVPAHAVRRGAWRSTGRTSPTCGAGCRSRTSASSSASPASGCSARSWPAAAPCAASSCPTPRAIRAARWTAWWTWPRGWAPPASCGRAGAPTASSPAR